MEQRETTRQQKISKQIQRDIADIFQKECRELFKGLLLTVTAVRVSPDFSYSKIYVSVFPFDKAEEVLSILERENRFIRKTLGTKLRHQVKSIPEIEFFIDDSLEYIENIDKAINR